MKSIAIVAALVFATVAMWWMETRFGPTFAMAVVGSLLGAIIVAGGVMIGLASNRASLNAAAEFHRSTMQTEQARLGLERERTKIDVERAKGERLLTDARAKLEVIDVKRIDKIVQQRAKLLAKPDDTPTWGNFADDDDGSYEAEFRHFE